MWPSDQSRDRGGGGGGGVSAVTHLPLSFAYAQGTAWRSGRGACPVLSISIILMVRITPLTLKYDDLNYASWCYLTEAAGIRLLLFIGRMMCNSTEQSVHSYLEFCVFLEIVQVMSILTIPTAHFSFQSYSDENNCSKVAKGGVRKVSGSIQEGE